MFPFSSNKYALYTIIVILLLLPLGQRALAQEPLTTQELTEIQQATYAVDSPFYYPTLFERYQQNDTTLTAEEYRYLYFGYTFQEDYNPYHENSYARELSNVAQRIEEDATQCDTIAKYATMAIDDFPFDIRNINILVYALRCKGMDDELALWSYKLHHLIQTILATGDGKTPQSAWHIINMAHEYDIINRLGLTAKEQRIENDYFDYITVERNNFDVVGYYFNVQRLSQEYDRKYSTY